MALSLSTIAAKDSAGTAIAGGLLAGDKSGAGTGPFILGNIIVDGLAGTNVAAITAANAIKVDGSGVTQPVSLASVPSHAVTNAGTFAVQNTAATPAGTNLIGKIQLSDGTTALPILAGSSGSPASSAPAVAVSVRDANANGQTTMSASAPVTIASDQSAVYTKPTITNLVSGTISTAMTGTTSTSLIAAPGAGLNNYITQVTVSNSHATVGTDVILQDGSGGTTLYVIPAAAVYGGATITFPVPLKQPTANTALFCANVTTGSSTKVSASGFKA